MDDIRATLSKEDSKQKPKIEKAMLDYCANAQKTLTAKENRITVVQTQKVLINTLVHLVYDYYNSSTIKERDSSFLVIEVICSFLCILVLRN